MSKFEDISGQKFGKLTVLCRAENRGKRTRFHCKCECGREIDVVATDLKSGNTKSCGCTHNRHFNINDELGKKYNHLTVIGQLPSERGVRVNCKCDCGKEVGFFLYQIKSGKAKSCGCLKRRMIGDKIFKDETGNTHGHLTVLEFVGMNKYGRADWLCKCECGREKIVCGADLRSGKVTSCGCVVSKGEQHIKNILDRHGVAYISQFFYSDLLGVSGWPLKFDVALVDENKQAYLLIEYDGRQHFEQTGAPWDDFFEFSYRQAYDYLKDVYARKHSIPLIRIPYTDLPLLKQSDDYLLSLISPYLSKIA